MSLSKRICPPIWLGLLLLSACRDGQTEGGVPAVHVRSDDPRLSFRQDTLMLDGTRFNGHVLAFHPDGDTAALTGYADGLEEGVSHRWHSNGRPSETRYFHRGRKTGIHRGWWEDGRPRFEYAFREGEHDGPLREWYPGGRPYKHLHYRMGYEEGSQRMWWENGTVRANYVVKDGRRFGLIGLKLCSNPGKDD